MKQLLQSLTTGESVIAEVPCPQTRPGEVLIHSHRSLISAGTERMLVEFGKANYIDKARRQPEKVKQVLDKVRTDGLLPTVDAVRSKLDQPLALGYCNVGEVLAVGAGVSGLAVGDRVISNGSHAEVVSVPMNLVSKIPVGVDDDEAVFTVIAAIGLQGIRLAEPTLGECFVVTGLGLIGLLTVQLLRAHGCRVLGIDFDSSKLALAREFGAETVDLSAGEDPVAAAAEFSRGRGVDGVLVAAATSSSQPIHEAAVMCRKRGRIVLVGVTGLELNRADFYEKELSFQVSCSYGPGRYEPGYEEQGLDYPIGFVRWTEQRNFEAVLDMMAEGKLDVESLISHRFEIDDAARAYELLSSDEPSLGILLEYPERPLDQVVETTVVLPQEAAQGLSGIASTLSSALGQRDTAESVRAAVIGAGNYSTRVFLPALKETGVSLVSVASSGGMSGYYAADKFGFQETTTDTARLIASDENNTVFILTRHDNHAALVCDALATGKHVFVEKPLAITEAQLQRVESAYAEALAEGHQPLLMVGFNRRFAPHIVEMKDLLDRSAAPKSMVMTVNAGEIPADHWTQSREVGGGRIIGEGCHFIDLLRFLAGSPIQQIQAMSIGDSPGEEVREDKMTITLGFGDGSLGTIHYFANGHGSYPKETLQVFCGGHVLELDNFRKLKGYGWPGFKSSRLWSQDKGHAAGIRAFVAAIEKGAPSPILFEELVEVTRASFRIVEQAL